MAGGWGVGVGDNWKGECSATEIEILTLAQSEQASRSNKYFFTFPQSFCFPVKIILEGNMTKYQTHPGHIQGLLPKVGLLGFFWFDSSELRKGSPYILEGVVYFKIYLSYRL